MGSSSQLRYLHGMPAGMNDTSVVDCECENIDRKIVHSADRSCSIHA